MSLKLKISCKLLSRQQTEFDLKTIQKMLSPFSSVLIVMVMNTIYFGYSMIDLVFERTIEYCAYLRITFKSIFYCIIYTKPSLCQKVSILNFSIVLRQNDELENNNWLKSDCSQLSLKNNSDDTSHPNFFLIVEKYSIIFMHYRFRE